MCLSCGCGEPFNTHDDPRNITYYTLAQAAQAARITPDEAVANIETTTAQVQRPAQALEELVQRPAILCDIDGVIGFLTEEIVAALNAHFGLELVVSEMTNYWIECVIDPDQGKWLVQQFNKTVFYENVAPDFTAIAALETMHKGGYEIIVASDRPPHTKAGTARWLKKWNIPYDELVIKGPGGKRAVADEHGPGDPLIVIDDDPKKMITIPRPGVELWSPARPWTPVDWKDHAGVTVFGAWTELLEYLHLPTNVPIPTFSRGVVPQAVKPQGDPVREQMSHPRPG